ncbi:sulfotransferase family 2 domain-containing protein [Vacuolonema iberomarrocanum]|uniref:sulfotransferase family 2 domain-containing protein n=1 Tax=Vacuolonema iberomarrocanum TaxID=3454632 RepID=UPI0019DCADDE|nr:sulfotransferase family 2 domain-containing protein [filamentous cyanobacterium LEGE 07170]
MNDLLIFLHIPKCGGVTFHRILEKNFTADQTFSVDGQDPWTSIELFLKQSFSSLEQIRLIKGHVLYGIHQFMPQKQFKYITFVRDPIARLDSLFRYAKSQAHHPLHDLAQHAMLSEFTLHPAVPDNFQTKLIAGVERDRLLEPCSLETYQRALRNIEQDFLFVGVLERFEASLVLLRTYNILQNIFYQKQNVTPLISTHSSYQEAQNNSEINERHRWDYRLYTYVLQNFSHSLLPSIPQQSIFSLKLQYFKFINRSVYSKLPKKAQPGIENLLSWIL